MNSNWSQTIQILNASLKLNLKTHSAVEFPRIAKKHMSDNFITFWKNRIHNRDLEKKLSVYSEVKSDFSQSNYLKLPFELRKNIARFICSNHSLNIEKARHRGNGVTSITCRVCDTGAV